MPKIDVRRRVPRPAKKIFALVADIESYPEFLPGCARARLFDRKEKNPRAELVFASKRLMLIGLPGEIAFTSAVSLNPEALTIEARQIEGLFESLTCIWRFKRISKTSCDVNCALRFAFRETWLHLAVTPLLKIAIWQTIAAFEARALKD